MPDTTNTRCSRHEKSFLALGTVNTLSVYCEYGSADDTRAEDALQLAFERVAQIDDRMSAYKYDSDISRLNRNAGGRPQTLHAETIDLLMRAKKFSGLSGGAFDITARPLSTLWGFAQKKYQIPEKEKIAEALRLVNYRDLLINASKQTACLRRKGQSVDLGGIAKGYAADEVKRILQECGMRSALINLGGNIVTLGGRQGEKPALCPWKIGIQNPLSPRGQAIGTIPARDCSVVTSASNEQFFIKDGIRYHHILDPRTGAPAQSGLLSVTAVCGNSADADALTTALFVLGPEQGNALLQQMCAQAVFVTQQMDVFMTGKLLREFEPIKGQVISRKEWA